MSLKDSRFLDTLKVEVQIVGVEQDPKSIGSTLHYQMAYILQDHALDLAIPSTTEALMISIDSNQVATYTHISRQIPTEELIKLLPSSWITNYEKLCRLQTIVKITSEPSYKTMDDDSVKIIFDRKKTKTPACFSTQYMITAFNLIGVEVLSFKPDGTLVHTFTSATCHKYWDVYTYRDYANDDNEEVEKGKGRSSPDKKLKQQLANDHKQIGLVGQLLGKFDYIIKYSPPNYHPQPLPKPTGWTTEDSPDVHPNPPKNPKPSTPPTILLCYRLA